MVELHAIDPRTASAGHTAPTAETSAEPKVSARNIDVFYGDKQAIFDCSIDIRDRSVTAFIGPSGCGKSTFLRCINRMNDTIDSCRVDGEVVIDGVDVNAKSVDPVPLRARVGMVFQKPNPFPKSIYDNVAYRVSTASRRDATNSTRSSSKASTGPACGMKSPTVCTSPAPAFPEASSSVWSSPGRSR